MSALVQITVTYVSTPPSTTSTVTIPVSAGLQTLDSAQTAASQTGFNALDVLLQGIVRRGGVQFADAAGIQNFVPMNQIVKIVAA